MRPATWVPVKVRSDRSKRVSGHESNTNCFSPGVSPPVLMWLTVRALVLILINLMSDVKQNGTLLTHNASPAQHQGPTSHTLLNTLQPTCRKLLAQHKERVPSTLNPTAHLQRMPCSAQRACPHAPRSAAGPSEPGSDPGCKASLALTQGAQKVLTYPQRTACSAQGACPHTPIQLLAPQSQALILAAEYT